VTDITDGDNVWRRIPPAMVVRDPKVDGGLRPSKEALTDDADLDPMSTYCARIVGELELDASSLLGTRSGNWAVFELAVGYLRNDEEQVVTHDPIEPPTEPYDPAHTIVIGEKPRARRERMALQGRIVLRRSV
jgi:hypothetical protein